MADEAGRPALDIVMAATDQIRNTVIELYREWYDADTEVARLREELDGVRARARAYIESMQEGPAEASIIGEVLWDNTTRITEMMALAGPKPTPLHEWSVSYDSETNRAVSGGWVPTGAQPLITTWSQVAASRSRRIAETRGDLTKWRITLDGAAREWFDDAASAWTRWDSDLYDRDEHELLGPGGELLAGGAFDSRHTDHVHVAPAAHWTDPMPPHFTSDGPRVRHITAGRDPQGVESTLCGLICNDGVSPSDWPECPECVSRDG